MEKDSRMASILSIVLGAASILLAFIFNILGFVAGGTGLFLAILDRRSGNSDGRYLYGLGLSIIGLALSVVVVIIVVIANNMAVS